MSFFPYQSFKHQFPDIDYNDVIGDMDVTTPGTTLIGAPGGVTWKDKSFLTRGRVTHGSSLTPGYKAGMSDGGALAESIYWNTVAPWVTIYPINVVAEGGDNSVTNCYVKLSKIKAYYFSIAAQQWVRIGSHGSGLPYINMGKWSLDFTTPIVGGATRIYAKDDGLPAYLCWDAGSQIMLHNPIIANTEFPGGGIDCGGIFVMCESQLCSPDNEVFTGGDGIPKYGLSVGADYYPSTDSAYNTTVLAGRQYLQAAGGGKFKRIPVDRSRQMHYFVTGIGADTYVDNTTPAYVANGAAYMYQSAADLQAQLPVIELHQTLPIEFFGPQTFVPTPLADGTYFGSADGNDANPGTIGSPKTYQGAVNAATAPGDVVFFRGGTLALTTAAHFSLWNVGTAAQPIIYEVYPGEVFTIDGAGITPGVGDQRRVNYSDSFQKLRGVRIINMPEYGIYNSGLDNMVDGCEIAYCSLSGVSNTGSRLTIINSWIHHCSDVGKFGGSYNNGGNADGISFSSGTGGKILHNLITDCSDDLIDTWQSLYTTVKYNICLRAGAGIGNGNGIKGGGGGVGAYAIIDHNLVAFCTGNGVDANTGIGVNMRNNTSAYNGGVGFVLEADTVHSGNVSIGDVSTHSGTGITGLRNSWEIAGTPVFLNIDPDSPDFLKVTQDGTFDGIGAHYI